MYSLWSILEHSFEGVNPKVEDKNPKIEYKNSKIEDKHPKVEDKNPNFSSKLFSNMSKTAKFSRINIRKNWQNIYPCSGTLYLEIKSTHPWINRSKQYNEEFITISVINCLSFEWLTSEAEYAIYNVVASCLHSKGL